MIMTLTGKLIGKAYSAMLHNSLLVLMLLCSLSFDVKAQNKEQIKDSDVLVFAEEMPAFPDGPKALIEAIVKTIIYPKDAIDRRIEGKVHVRFIVTKEGKAVQPSIIKGLLPSLDAEVLNAINRLPKFAPGKNGGVPVNVWYAVPISFKISE